jgi:hypothetical protein
VTFLPQARDARLNHALHIGVVRSPLGARVLGVKIVSLRFVRA